MAILNKRISSATLPQLQKNTRLESIIRDAASAPAVTNDTFRTINPSMSASNAISPAYVSQLTSALREMQPQNVTSRIAAPTRSNDVSLMSSQMPDMSAVPNISKGPITSITSPGDSPRQKIGSTTTTSGGVSNAVINALAGAVMGLGAQKVLTGGNKSGSQTGGNKSSNNSSSSNLPAWAKGNPTIKDNGNGTYTQTNDDGSTSTMDKDGNIIGTTDSNGDIVDKNGNTVHDNGNGTHTITARDGTITIRNDDGTDITDQNAKVVPAPVDDYTEYPVIDDTSVGDFKRGGLAVMMKDGGVPHFADAGAVTSTDTTSDPVQSLLDLLKTSGGAAGAGGLLAALLSSTGGNQNTQNTGLDMSTYGLLKPRTTNFGMGPAKYVTHRDYSQRGNYTPNTELLSNLNAPASNPVNEGDYQSPYITNRPGTNNNMAGGTDINAIIAQIVNALKNQQLAQNVNQASGAPTGGAVTTTAGSANTPTGGGFTVGGGNTGGEYGAFGGKAGYDKAVADETARRNAEQAKLAAFKYDPNSTLGKLIDNPSSIPHLYGETDAQAANRIKSQLMSQTQLSNDRATEAQNFSGNEFVITNPDQAPVGVGTPQVVDPAEQARLMAAHDAEVAKSMGSGLFTTGGGLPSAAGRSQADLQAEHDANVAASMASGQFTTGGAKAGGAIHKATGGLTHYTYGKPADVMENLGLREQQMAQGGLPHVSNVPVVEGRMDFRQGSAVHGEGDGQSDDIPAMLADGEYVIDAETVAQIGNGSTKAGAQALDKFRESIRAHKRSAPINKIPPKTKALTSYLKVK